MVQSMFKRWSGKFQAVLWGGMLILSLAAVIGCSSGGSGGGGVLFSGDPQVQVGDATLTCANETDMIACRGIKYAEAERFATSHLVDPTGEIDATAFGSACVQDDGTGSEDCLYLNVFFPKGTNLSDNLPVMVWIHGGALIQGSGSVPGYDLPALVNEDVIVVTINYRLNAFGFLPHPALEDPTGNFGLKDQVKALEWVKQYIADFGGNPDNVTIFGESAGGHSVLSLLVSAVKDNGLFHKAIVQSGSYSPTQTPLSLGYYTLGAAFGDLNGYPNVVSGFPPTGVGPCSGTNEEILTCLRGLTVEQVMAAQNAGPAWAWITPAYAAGTFLPKNIATALTDGDVAAVPVMIGNNLHEGTLFAALFMNDFGGLIDEGPYRTAVASLLATDPRAYDRIKTADDYVTWATTLYGDNANKYRNADSMVWTDSVFACNTAQQSNYLSMRPGVNTYAYWFADEDAPINPTYSSLSLLSSLFNFGDWGVGAVHSFEIQYIFGTVQDHANVTPDQTNLSNRMIAYWTNFAKDGAPGGEWTAYDAATNIRKLHPTGDTNASVVNFVTTHHCAQWALPGNYWPVEPEE